MQQKRKTLSKLRSGCWVRPVVSFDRRTNMDLLVRHRSAERNVDQVVEAETQDHMDHTFTGIMFDVKAHDLPFRRNHVNLAQGKARADLHLVNSWWVQGKARGYKRVGEQL